MLCIKLPGIFFQEVLKKVHTTFLKWKEDLLPLTDIVLKRSNAVVALILHIISMQIKDIQIVTTFPLTYEVFSYHYIVIKVIVIIFKVFFFFLRQE